MTRALEPLDIVRRHGRRLAWLRRGALAASCALTFGVPLWNLASERARAEAWVIGGPPVIRIFGLELLDPMLALGAALRSGLTPALMLAALPGVLLVALLGRVFCGWACPYLPLLSVSQSVRWVFARLGLPLPNLALPRATAVGVLVVALGAAAILGSQLAPLLYPPSLLGREAQRLLLYGSVGVGAALLFGVFLFDTFVSRAGFCRSVCPGGAMFSLLSLASPLRVARDPEACTECSACDVVCHLGQRPMMDRLDAGCERCGKCIAVCPTQALRFSLRRGEDQPRRRGGA